MAGDYSRRTFDPKNHFSAVLTQQGRVQLDADWNEGVELQDRRWRAETTDVIGRCGVPQETPDGFKIDIADGTLTIGRGRIYVDGLLAENHGRPPLEFDGVLAEERGSAPTFYADADPQLMQPYFPEPPPLPEEGRHLVFLDVWQREVTFLEKPELVEKAVGVDTTTRLQTVWQVRVLPDDGSDVTCDTPDDQILGWQDVTQPSAGRLSTGSVEVLDDEDPCLIPPNGGYRGLENRLYRVEIHEGGVLGTATFKWSYDNASIATAVTAILEPDSLRVEQTQWDSFRRFSAGDWIEIIDDVHEFSGKPGLIRKVSAVDDEMGTITLTEELTVDEFATDSVALADRHTRMRRWDTGDDALFFDGDNDDDDLDTIAVIPVPAAGTAIDLKDGVQITFDIDPAGGEFRVGDYWVFAARHADASVEILENAPPIGIHHHYCRLALIDFERGSLPVEDCRPSFPPLTNICAEDVCYDDSRCNLEATTVQEAIDALCQREPGQGGQPTRFNRVINANWHHDEVLDRDALLDRFGPFDDDEHGFVVRFARPVLAMTLHNRSAFVLIRRREVSEFEVQFECDCEVPMQVQPVSVDEAVDSTRVLWLVGNDLIEAEFELLRSAVVIEDRLVNGVRLIPRDLLWGRFIEELRRDQSVLRLTVVLRGDWILDEEARGLDGNHLWPGVPEGPTAVGIDGRPSGNGTEGGDWISIIHLDRG